MNIEKLIQVSEGDPWRKARSPYILTSGGLGPCIALGALYGKGFHYGILGHFAVPRIDSRFTSQLEELQKLKAQHALRLYLVGGCSCHDDAKIFALGYDKVTAHAYILQQLQDRDLLSSLRKDWTCNARVCSREHNARLDLFLSQGRAHFERTSRRRR